MVATLNKEGVDYSGDDLRRIDYLPSPSDIAEACQSIRDSWSISEKRRRFVGELPFDEEETLWRPPVVDTTHFRITLARGVEANS